ncbi:MAG TPA: hypothetical protein VK469_03335 [Candidatus Kapabacteria bacterium]|nr:hypothetical protein [Candidatus Kapabacteria bacterium]
MCGIFGISVGKNTRFSPCQFKSSCNRLFRLSESRGKEASGLAILAADKIAIYKNNIPAGRLIRGKKYDELFSDAFGGQKSLIKYIENTVIAVGHSRLVTNGTQESYGNNQPVVKDGAVAVHNGIIVNIDQLWNQYPDLERHFEVDSEIILSLIAKFYQENKSLRAAVQQTYAQIEGTAAVAILLQELNRMVLATNNGSLYMAKNTVNNDFVFASEEYILKKFLSKGYRTKHDRFEILPVAAGTGYIIDIADLGMEAFSLEQQKNGNRQYRFPAVESIQKNLIVPPGLHHHFLTCEAAIKSLKRCRKCILPGTIPFIEFDGDGVCNVCRDYKKHPLKGEDALKEAIEKYLEKYRRQTTNVAKPDCIVAFSGGRDSSYGLHYIKNVLKMKPVSYTYDWGMITDLARRNIARICSRLGIENIVISADICQKRRNIGKNVTAWLKKPEIGMIPLFMAGDKHFFYHVNRLKKRTGIPLDIWCFNIHEKADFKEEFSGIKMWNPKNKQDAGARIATELRSSKSLLLGLYYTKNFLKNKHYLNSSLFDSFTGYISYYFLEKDLLSLYDYIEWNEKDIVETLINEYNWETSPDTRSTWRIGDGTAAFYNYIYYIVTGFSENDWFRSNQIREGMISREEIMELIYEENKPRWDSLKWYCDTIGIDYLEAIEIINKIPKLYRID